MKHNLALTLWLILFINSSIAQFNNIRFDLISIEDGLSQSTPNTVFQDKKGFIWIGTQDGLNLYDGHKFKIFRNDPDDSLSLVDNFIHCIAEDKNGFIWVGTENGLCYYNRSNNRFRTIDFNQKISDLKRSNIVNALAFDEHNDLWVGTEGGGLYKLTVLNIERPGEKLIVKHYTTSSSLIKLSDNVVKSLLVFKNKILVGTGYGGINVLDIDKQNVLIINNIQDAPFKLSGNDVRALAIDSKKRRIFAATDNGVNILDSKRFNVMRVISSGEGLSDNSVSSLLIDREDNLWIGTNHGLDELNLATGRISHYFNQPNNPHSLVDNKIESLFEDNAGVIWVGTTLGLNKFDRIKQNFITFKHIENNPHSLASDNVWSLYQDNKGIIWVGTDFGIDRIDRKEGSIRHYFFSKDKSQIVSVNKILPWKDHFLVASDYGVYNFYPDKGTFEILESSDDSYKLYNNRRSYGIVADHYENLWISTREGILLFENKTRKFKSFVNDPVNKKSLPHNTVRMILIDKDKNFYVATSGGGVARFRPHYSSGGVVSEIHFEVFKNVPGNKKTLNNNNALTIYQSPDGLLWIGTFGGGLNCFNPVTEEFVHFTEKDGLCNNVIYGIVPDNQGNLWMSTNRGISCFNPRTKDFQNYYEQDGIQSNEFNAGAYSAGVADEIMFGGIKGFNLFYPSRFKKNLTPPTPTLTGLYIFNKEILPGKNSPIKRDISEVDQINLSYKENSFNLEFSALHYSNPANNRYSYILEGVEEEWNHVGARNYAYYTKLEPGEYIFRLRAANSDGVWCKKELTVRLIITPPFWKTLWFRIALFLVVSFALWLAYRTRINLIKEQKRYLEMQIKERTQKIWQQKEEIEQKNLELAKEKEKVERLLLNILPAETADELKNKGKAQARHYRLVSVMFTDFIGFTLKSEKLRPQEIVEMLDFYFIKFDEIIAKYNIEKIKTIGDAYMAAGGVPTRNKSNPIDIILAGLEIQRFVKSVKEERIQSGGNYFECRIGIHTGEIIAGVVGIKRFAYDIWGDTVNVASRMESSSEVGKVNISGATYQLAKEFFVCSHRGKILAKNKGEIDMYFVEGIRPELSVNGEGIIPNEAFFDRLEHILYSKINYKKAERHIIKLLESSLPEGLFYHGLHHTLDVCKSAEEIALAEGVNGEDIHILKTAALLHDAGFTKQYTSNELIACQIARETLPQFGYSAKQIKMVEELILATAVPQNPKNRLEQIICDADLDYLGREAEEFYAISQSLYEELKAFGMIDDPVKWDEIQVSFLTNHRYFTKTNILRRQPNKLKRIEEIRERLKNQKRNV